MESTDIEPAGAERVDAGRANAHPADGEPGREPDGEPGRERRDANPAAVDGVAAVPVRSCRSHRSHAAWPGMLAVVLAIACAGLVAAGVAVAVAGDFPVSTLLARLAIGCSIASIVSGVVAIVLGRGRAWGIAGCALGIVANPLVAVVVLRIFDGI